MYGITQKISKTNFTHISNILVMDTNLSCESKGLFLILWSHCDDWKFYNKDIMKKANCKKDKLNRMYKELTEQGYLLRQQQKNDKGHFTHQKFILSDEGNLKDIYTDNGKTDNGLTVNGKTVTNNTNSNNTKLKEEEEKKKKEKLSDFEIDFIKNWIPQKLTIDYIENTFLLIELAFMEEVKNFKRYLLTNNKIYKDLDSSFIVHIKTGIDKGLIQINC
jgi:hypothetical protein